MLDHLVVLELASVLAGPSVGQFFAELGARVIKIENPDSGGDVTRTWYRGGESRLESASYFNACNFGKESVGLRLRGDDGRRVLRHLVEASDVLLTSFGPGSAQRLGLGPAIFRDWNPGIVHGAITGYGQQRSRAGYDAVIQAESGFMSMNGLSGGPPVKMPVALIDVLAAHQLKEGLLLALLRRQAVSDPGDASARYAYVEVSLMDAALSALVNQATGWMSTGRDPSRIGSRHPSIAPYGTLLETRDGKSILLAVGTDRQFERLCGILGADGLAADARFKTNADRVDNRDALEDELAKHFAQRDAHVLLDLLHESAIPAGRIHSVSEALDTFGSDVVLPEPGGLRQFVAKGESGAAGVFAPATNRTLRPPPDPFEHTRSVLTELAGFQEQELEQLGETGAIQL